MLFQGLLARYLQFAWTALGDTWCSMCMGVGLDLEGGGWHIGQGQRFLATYLEFASVDDIMGYMGGDLKLIKFWVTSSRSKVTRYAI